MKKIIILSSILSLFSCKDQLQTSIEPTINPEDCFSKTDRYVPSYSLLRYENEITKLEKKDSLQNNYNLKNSVIFYGSSSFSLWNSTLPNDFPNLNVIGHGFGGSTFPELIYFKQRMIKRYSPKTILIYCENDLVNPPAKTVEQVYADACYLVSDIHSLFPKTKIFFVSLKHSPARRFLISSFDKVNALLKNSTLDKSYLGYIDINPAMYKSDQKTLDGSIFQSDSLHMNRKGYERWISIIKPILEADYKSR